MSAKTKSRKATPRARSHVAAQQKPRKSAATTTKTRQHRSPAAASAVKARSTAKSATTTPSSKQARLIALLSAPAGGTLAQMMALTGWQAHTVRGTISGVLRKKRGLTVTCASQTKSGERRYRIVGPAVEA